MPRRSASRGRCPAARGATIRAAVLALTLTVTSAACTTADDSGAAATSRAAAATPGPTLTWAAVPLPGGASPLVLATSGDTLLVGGLAPAGAGKPPAPRLFALDGSAATTVPLTPASGYGHEARWYSLVTDGRRIVAIGGANGGAHGNVRWSTWSGTTRGVVEQPQSFYAFGGWGAGDLLDAVITPTGPVLVGTWGSDTAGLDAAVWLQTGTRWDRQDPAGTALASTPQLLAGPRAAVASGPGVLVVGSAVHLGAGSVAQQAAVWGSSGPNAGWRRLDLPRAGRVSEAVAARCAGTACTVVGRVDDALAVWEVDGDSARRLDGIPAVAVGDSTSLPPPLDLGGDLALVVPAGDHAAVLRHAGGAWTSTPGPTGMPVRAVVVDGHLAVTTAPAAGAAATLWSAPLP